MTNRERQEFERLPARIAALEASQRALHAEMTSAAFYQRSREAIAEAGQRSEAIGHEIEAAYARWAELEALNA